MLKQALLCYWNLCDTVVCAMQPVRFNAEACTNVLQ